ncbi:25174_t:CDS:10, partial [Cetraspora pellucida]
MKESIKDYKKRLHYEQQQYYRNKKKKLISNNREELITNHQIGETSYAATLQVELSQELEANVSTLNLDFRPIQDDLTIVSTALVANISLVTAQLQQLKAHNIRMYNSALAFMFIGVTIDHSVTGTSSVYSFCIHDEMYYSIGFLFPEENNSNNQPKFAQIYIYDTEHELQNRMNQMLYDINPYCRIFNQATNILNSNSIFNFRMVITDSRSKDSRHYNTPTTSEVAIIMVGIKRISELHHAYESLHYVLMFPRGEDGWHLYIPTTDMSFSISLPSNSEPELLIIDEEEGICIIKYITAMKYYAYHLYLGCPNKLIVIYLFGRLFQQWVVDIGLQDTMQARDSITTMSNVGQHVILPSILGKPNLFITITCNPQWPEITNALLLGQTSQDRPDLIACVFNLKLKTLFKVILKEEILGKIITYIYTIEFQKRGLPHVHCLFILDPAYKPNSIVNYDPIVSAEIPDANIDLYIFKTIKCSMMHDPYKKTVINNDSYPVYMQRDNDRTVEVRHDYATIELRRPANEHEQHVNIDEINLYLDAQYVSVSEASWRLFYYKLHNRNPAIMQLQIHLSGNIEEAYDALGLLQNNDKWDQCLSESAFIQSESQLHYLFATLLLFCNLIHLEALWEKYFTSLSDDIRLQFSDISNSNTNLQNQALFYLQFILNKHSRSLQEFPNMSIPHIISDSDQSIQLLAEEKDYNIKDLIHTIETRIPLLNTDQKAIFSKVISAIDICTPTVLFVDDPSKTGKTFLYNIILAKVHLSGHIALADEAPIAYRNAPEALNRILQDLMKAIDPFFEHLPFEGKVVIFGGDFHQIFPIVVKGSCEDIVGSCLKHSPLWTNIDVMFLKTNMCLLNSTNTSNIFEKTEFTEWLLKIGEGLIPTIDNQSDTIQLPRNIHTILTPKNDDVNTINSTIMSYFPEELIQYLSTNTIEKQNDNMHIYP